MRIVIADDAVLLREGAAGLLTEAGHQVVAQANDADDLLRKLRAHRSHLDRRAGRRGERAA